MKQISTEYRIKELSLSDQGVARNISLFNHHAHHLELAHWLPGMSVTQDQGSLGGKSRNKLFLAVNAHTDKIEGLVHFRINGRRVALNRLKIFSADSGHDLTKYLLLSGLKELAKKEDVGAFEVNVFEKDKKLFNLLLNLGMEISEYRFWYDITEYCSLRKEADSGKSRFNKADFKIKADPTGSSALLHEQKTVGLIIRDHYLLVQSPIDYSLFEKIRFYFKDSALKSVYLISKKDLELFLLDKSFYLTIPFKKLEPLHTTL